MFKNLIEKNYLQLIWFGIILLFSSLILMGLGYIAGIGIWGEQDVTAALGGFLDNQNQINILKMFQVLNQLAMFIIPPFSLYFIIRKTNRNYLNLNIIPDISIFFALTLLFIFSLPVIQATMAFNQKMVLPEAMSSIETWMKNKESIAEEITIKFLNVDLFSGFVLNIIMMALLPAIGEELVFRALLMRWFSKSINNIHIIIVITAFLFSAIHMQFFGFLPRFLLGIILGYSYYWTKSLWAPIWLHFINNATTVSVFYWIHKSHSNINPDEVGNVDGYGYLLVATIAIGVILYWIYKNRNLDREIA
jgi:membrane protease YdiL (CAAX protease family)